jgi:putative membrane protein
MTNPTRSLVILGTIWLAGLVLSGWSPHDRATWWMEVAPVLIAWPILFVLRHRFAFTPLALVLIGFHGLVLMLGGAYTYARVPLGFAVQDWLGLARNPYDRFGHLMQGFVPAIVIRELFVRRAWLRVPGLVAPVVLLICLAISALYELIEFGAAVALGQGADAFLGTQGDVWDTQWDMLMCLTGAALALITLSRWHDAMCRDRSFIQGSASAD